MNRLLAFLAWSLVLALVHPAAADPEGPVIEIAGYTCVVPPGVPCPPTNQEIGIRFDEAVDPVDAADPANYLFHLVDDPESVIAVAEVPAVWDDEVFIILAELPAEEDYLLTVSGVEDLEGNPMATQSWVIEPMLDPDSVPDLLRPVLMPAAPNPFNPATELSFVLPVDGPVELAAYDLAGRRVATLIDAHLPAGDHDHRWRADGLGSGTYLVRLVAGGLAAVQKVSLVR